MPIPFRLEYVIERLDSPGKREAPPTRRLRASAAIWDDDRARLFLRLGREAQGETVNASVSVSLFPETSSRTSISRV